MWATSHVALPSAAAVLASAVLFGAPTEAHAHAAFVGASPVPGSRSEVAPSEVVLSFSEPVNRRLTRVSLISVASGKELVADVGTSDGSRLVVRRRGTWPAGAYRVVWHTVSTLDGHALEGSFSFGVRAPAASGTHTLEQSPLARHGWIRVVLRALLYVAVLPFVAALVLPRLVATRRSWLVPATLEDDGERARVRRREASWTEILGWSAAAAAVATTWAESADAARSLAPAALDDFLLANAAGVARLAVVALLGAAALTWQRLPRTATALAVLALGAIAASGHAASASPREGSVLNDWLHLVSAALWVGGMVLLMLVWSRPLRRASAALRVAVARDVLAPYGRVALPAFVVVSWTGLLSLANQLGHLSALWQTDYGRLLALKVLVVGLIAGASGVHALRLRPRLLAALAPQPARSDRGHWRLVRSESVLSLLVAGLVAVLVAFPLPPRQLGEAAGARAAATSCSPCPLPSPSPEELPVATQAGSHLVAAWIRRSGESLGGTIRVSDVRGRPAAARLRILASRQASCGVGCWRFEARRATDRLRMRIWERGRWHDAALPARWRVSGTGAARRLLGRAQRTMRDLDAVRSTEVVTSGPGSFARTAYRIAGPDRMALRTDQGTEIVIVGAAQWLRSANGSWIHSRYGEGLPFRTRRWFRWTTYGRFVRLLRVERRHGRRLATLALFDPGTPAWSRLTVALRTGLVLREQMAAKAHFMTTRYHGFNMPLVIEPPEDVDGR